MDKFLEILKDEAILPKSAFLYSEEFFQASTFHLWEKFKTNHPVQSALYEKESEIHSQMIHRLMPLLETNSNLKESADIEKIKITLRNELYKPLTWEKVMQNEKLILVARKPVILVSVCLQYIEAALVAHPDIKEVHFVAREVIYIDANLKKSTWHGKNIVVISKKIMCVIPDIVWDVSGVDGENASETTAPDGTDEDIDGQDGVDAQPGESGGSGMLITEKFDNALYLCFNGSGGAGGKGQRGGHGKNGVDGENGDEMSLETLKTKFESPAVKLGLLRSHARFNTLLANLKNEITQFEMYYFDGISKVDGISGLFSLGSCHITGKTESGIHIEFAFCSRIGEHKHVYILVKGALGKPGTFGGLGGSGGFGGEGGNQGKFSVYTLSGSEYQWESENFPPNFVLDKGFNGINGDDGQDGLNGKYGKNGLDVGYLDRSTWLHRSLHGPGTLELTETTEKGFRVWCSHREEYICIKTVSRDPPHAPQQTRTNNRKTKVTVAATKKIDTSFQEILKCYNKEIHAVNFCLSEELIRITQNIMLLSNNKVTCEVDILENQNVVLDSIQTSRSIEPLEQQRLTTLRQVRLQALGKIEEEMNGIWNDWKKTKYKVYQQMEQILRKLYSFQDESEISEFLQSKEYLHILTPFQEDIQDDSKLSAMINKISEYFEDTAETLLTKDIIFKWSPLLVNVFHDILENSNKTKLSQLMPVMRKMIQEFLSNNEDQQKLAHFLWKIGTHSESEWSRELCMILAEHYFTGVSDGDLRKWKALIKSFSENYVLGIMNILLSGTKFQKNDKTAFLAHLVEIGIST